ncbi:MAG: type I DNA topoisomerase [Deltaproteobacteria bacterium]|nr:type I DNA topoisomerase [Deltaproteobacteria bacterium]
MAEQKKKKSRGVKGTSSPNTGGKQLVIVESPAKARTINRYLGPEYVVMASVGHVRDLPNKNPKGVRNPVPGVDLENNFSPTYTTIRGKKKTVDELRKAARNAGGIWLATDLDREGEAIAWHLTEALGVPLEEANRVVFNAITQGEIRKAFEHPRKIDINKVNAQQARRILDRIVGYQVSPLLWKKVAGGLSAGRVQSVAVRLVVEREREIGEFVPEEYWRVTACFTARPGEAAGLREAWEAWLAEAPATKNGRKANGRTIREKNGWLAGHDSFMAELVEIGGKKFEAGDAESVISTLERIGYQVTGRDDTEDPDAKGPARHQVRIAGRLADPSPWRIRSIRTKRTQSKPSPPFITSTLQQTAANQLGLPAQATMRIAQSLYEGVTIKGSGSVGLITYMRTDSTHLSGEAVDMAREYIASRFGKPYLPSGANVYTSSNKSAQEAHEAIRPTDITLTPDAVRGSLDDRQFKLYKLIWERFVACQMTNAQWDTSTVLVEGPLDEQAGTAEKPAGTAVFRATGRTLVFDGHYRVSGVPNQSEEAVLPALAEGRDVGAFSMQPAQHFTQPPPRYTEASLVKKLETEGIGRPSTYAAIIQVIQDRKYVEKLQGRFYATDLGEVVTDKLMEAFPEILQVGYTREMEQKLDDIEEKDADWIQMLKEFYGPFQRDLNAAYEGMEHAKAETEPAPHTCPECGGGTVYRFGKNGRFLSCARYPHCTFAAPIDRDGNPVEPTRTDVACPKCGKPMMLRKGRYGPFLSCTGYPECGGLLNLDRKGAVEPPKVPPLLTDLECPKCSAPLNLRRGARGPWLSCSKFPKCRGRLGWASLDPKVKERWEKALEAHEKAHPQPVIRNVHGEPLPENHQPRELSSDND